VPVFELLVAAVGFARSAIQRQHYFSTATTHTLAHSHTTQQQQQQQQHDVPAQSNCRQAQEEIHHELPATVQVGVRDEAGDAHEQARLGSAGAEKSSGQSRLLESGKRRDASQNALTKQSERLQNLQRDQVIEKLKAMKGYKPTEAEKIEQAEDWKLWEVQQAEMAKKRAAGIYKRVGPELWDGAHGLTQRSTYSDNGHEKELEKWTLNADLLQDPMAGFPELKVRYYDTGIESFSQSFNSGDIKGVFLLFDNLVQFAKKRCEDGDSSEAANWGGVSIVLHFRHMVGFWTRVGEKR
jgi:hypothetical protein